MVANKTLTLDSLFGADFVATADKLVAIPGAAWYSGALFQNPGGVNAKPGEWVAAPPLYWKDGDKVTGNVGGGVWYASSHTTHPDAVKTFLEFIVIRREDGRHRRAARLQGGGGEVARSAGLERLLCRRLQGGDLCCGSSVWNGWGYPNFSPETSWAKVITPGLAAGKTMAELAAEWQQEMKNEAQVVGYTVE